MFNHELNIKAFRIDYSLNQLIYVKIADSGTIRAARVYD